MKYHHPSFMHYFLQQFDVSFNIYSHNFMLCVIPPNAYFTPDLLLDFFTDALIDSVERPLLTPTGPQSRSLFETPPVPHCLALAQALSMSWKHILNQRVFQSERGERQEYKVNLRVVRGIMIDVRRSEDTARALYEIQDERNMSNRYLLEKVLRHDGRDIGRTRAAQAMKGLVELEYCEDNGNLRTLGREVLKWPKP